VISRSENFGSGSTGGVADHGVIARLPLDAPRSTWRSADNVSRLRFEMLEMVDADNVEREGVRPGAAEAGTCCLKEQIAALEAQMRFQSETALEEVEAARRAGRQDAKDECVEEFEERLKAEQEKIQQVCTNFTKERQRYFVQVEGEVVKLALAIAARVLHREAKIDPTMLTSAVRVALGRMQEDSGVVLRVSTEDEAMWREVAGVGDWAQVQLVADERMLAGECVLETNVGKIELGVSAQLEEIEKGFFDLLQRRPA
jgi:flagellar assembly protein FliH